VTAAAVDSLKENVAATSAAAGGGGGSAGGGAAVEAASAAASCAWGPGCRLAGSKWPGTSPPLAQSLLSLLGDMPTVKTTVSIGQAQLMLWNAQPEGLPPAAVGSVEFSNLWVVLHLTQAGNMLLSLSLAKRLCPGSETRGAQGASLGTVHGSRGLC